MKTKTPLVKTARVHKTKAVNKTAAVKSEDAVEAVKTEPVKSEPVKTEPIPMEIAPWTCTRCTYMHTNVSERMFMSCAMCTTMKTLNK